MGYTDPRFVNKTFVQPTPGGGAVPSGGAEGFTAFAKVFDAGAAKAREADIRADKKRAAVLGQNSVTIDENGNVSRAARPDTITTQAGKDLFDETQRSIAYTTRSNAIARKGAELSVKYRFDPNGIQKFTEDMAEYGKQFINDADKDNAGRLALTFEDIMKKGIIGITQTIEEREWKEAVEQNQISLTRIISNIQEAEVQGLSTEAYQMQLFDQLELARRAGWIDLETQMAYVKDSQISRYAGELFKRAMEAPKANLSKVRKEIHKKLFKGGDKEAGFDIDADEIDAIMARVDQHINYVLHVGNLETQEQNTAYADKMYSIMLAASDQTNPMTPVELQRRLNSENITKKMIKESPYLRKQMITLNRLTTGNKDKLDILASRSQIAKYEEALITATEETYAARWIEVEQANLGGLFDRHESAYIRLLNSHTARIKAFLTEGKKRSDQYYEDKFSFLAYSGQLNNRILGRLRATGKFGKDDKGKPDLAMQRWLQDNEPKVAGWIKRYHGDLGPLMKAYANRADGGFQATGKDMADADRIMNAEEKRLREDGKPSLYSQNTGEGVRNIIARVDKDGIMSGRANDVLQKWAFSTDVLEAEKGAQIWLGMADDRTKKGGQIRQSVRGPTRTRLILMSEFFSPGFSRGDTEEAIKKAQDDFTRFMNVRFGGENSERIREYVDDIDKNKFNEMWGFHQDATVAEERAQGITNFVPHILAWRIFFRPDEEKTNMRKFVKFDKDGGTDLIAHDFDPPSVAVTDQLHRIFRVKRLQYQPGEHGDIQAMEDTAAAAIRTNLVGPTNWSPPRRIVDGEFVDENQGGIIFDGSVKLELRPLEGYFNHPEEAHAAMEDRVRTLLNKFPKSVRDTFPDVIGNWFERNLGPIATLGINKLQRWAGWTDLVDSRWIRTTPDLARSTRSIGVYEIVLQDPDDPKARPFVISGKGGETFQQSDFDKLNAFDYREHIRKGARLRRKAEQRRLTISRETGADTLIEEPR
jgi:hypothetical protein